jgi:hypothetical protein
MAMNDSAIATKLKRAARAVEPDQMLTTGAALAELE